MKPIVATISLLTLLTVIPVAANGDEEKADDAQILEWFKELKPLQKVHYSFPLRGVRSRCEFE